MEQGLYEAKMRGHWSAYYEVLAGADLFARVVPDETGELGPDIRQDPHTGAPLLCLYTDGMLPVPSADQLFKLASLKSFAKDWDELPFTLVVNPGSPCEGVLYTAPPHNAPWLSIARRAGHPDFSGTLRALRVGGPLHGPVAHGLACGALMSVKNGYLWNALAFHGNGYETEREQLERWWGVTSRAEWQRTLQRLLARENLSPVWEFALDLRHSIARDFGGHVETEYWREAAANVLRSRSEGATVLTPDGVTRTDPRPESEVRAQISGVQHLIGRITRYEARMRADGILAEGRYVRSVDAWDLGRGASMACWGVGARYGTVEEAERAVVEVGEQSAVTYSSWEDFSAGYILGRCLHFDEERFGSWYKEMLTCHRVLTTDPASPWLNIPFR
ncbi:DUF1266 domain-containing protein [Streptomyces sp. BH104]|uniref:DUF1266 domain-containing protein n=3 Tax=unclassified Streptomyces TaxID=2593676 RepID=UPI003BB73E9A